MAEEDQMVTDEDLDRAAEAPETSDAEPEVEDDNPVEDNAPAEPAGEEAEEVVEEEIPAEPEDNTVRSELGRKVKEQGETLQAFMDSITGAIDEIKTMVTKPVVEEEEDDDEPVFLTKAQFRQQIRDSVATLTKEQQEGNRKYERGYMTKVAELTSGMSDEEKAEVSKELFENKDINVKRSGNPKIDAEINFLKAQTNVLRRQAIVSKKPVNPLDKNKDNPDLPLGGPSGTRNQETKSEKIVKLDPEAAKFAKASGMTDEEVQEALSGPMPTYLGGQ